MGIVDYQDSRKRYPLHICALHGHTEASKLLLDQGAVLDVLDEDERTPFTAAAQFGQNEIIGKFLLFDQPMYTCSNSQCCRTVFKIQS